MSPDRETPVVGRQSWRDLVFLHWHLPPEEVRPIVPPPFELDLHEGRAWVGIVAFRVRGLRARFVPFGLDFHETNLRTYVRWNDEAAIWFVALDAASRLAVAGARAGYGLPYHHARMTETRDEDAREYAHVRASDRASFRVRYRVGEAIGTATPGSLDAFLVERYRFHTLRFGSVLATEVRHPPYPLHRLGLIALEESLFAAAGLPPVRSNPVTHYSPGVDVDLLATRPAGA